MSTEFHPQTDKQTERANRTLQEVFRHTVSSTHDDWDVLLGGAELAISSACHCVIDFTPFMLNYGQEPRLPLDMGLPDPINDGSARLTRPMSADYAIKVPAASRLHGNLTSVHATVKGLLAEATEAEAVRGSAPP